MSESRTRADYPVGTRVRVTKPGDDLGRLGTVNEYDGPLGVKMVPVKIDNDSFPWGWLYEVDEVVPLADEAATIGADGRESGRER